MKRIIILSLAVLFLTQLNMISAAENGGEDVLAVVRVGDKCGYIDKTGKFIVEPQFDETLDFS